jgi:hypothetical protein
MDNLNSSYGELMRLIAKAESSLAALEMRRFDLLELVRLSTAAVAADKLDELHGVHVAIDDKAIDRWANEVSLDRLTENARGMQFPLKFDSIQQHINFLCTLNLLNFGSGFRKPLHDKTGKVSCAR